MASDSLIEGAGTINRPVPIWQRVLIGRRPKRTLIRAVILGAVVFLIFRYFLIGIRIYGISMEPTYLNRQRNIVNRLSYVFSKPQRGDVVGVANLHGFARPQYMYLKRIIGLPNETIEIHRGTVWINGEPLNEPYVRFREPWEEAPQKLAGDEYFVIGDNRGMPQEFHEHGKAYTSEIVGKVLW
jgi:signal peptidase I